MSNVATSTGGALVQGVTALVSAVVEQNSRVTVTVVAGKSDASSTCSAFAAIAAVSHVYCVADGDVNVSVPGVTHVCCAVSALPGTIDAATCDSVRCADIVYVMASGDPDADRSMLSSVVRLFRPRVALAGDHYGRRDGRTTVLHCVGDAQREFSGGLWAIRVSGTNLAPCGVTRNKVAIVWATDGNDSEYMRYSVGSMRAEVKTPCDFIVLAEPSADLHDIDRVHGVLRIDPGPYLAALGISKAEYDKHKGCPYPTLYRLAIPLISRFCCYTHTLYVDSDTMAVRGSVRKVDELFSYPLGEFEIAGSTDLYLDPENTATNIRKAVPDHLRDELSTRVWSKYGNQIKTPINAGVVLWNTQHIDRLWYIRRCCEFCGMLGRMTFADQGFMNCMMAVDNSIPAVFNSAYVGGGPYALGKACIRHYTGAAKQALRNAGRHDPDLVQDARFEQAPCTPRRDAPVFDVHGKRCIVWCCTTDAACIRRVAYSVRQTQAMVASRKLDAACIVLCDGEGAQRAAAGVPARLVDIGALVSSLGFRERGRSNWRGGWIFWDASLLNRLLLPFVPELRDYSSALFMCSGLYPCDARFLDLFSLDLTGYDCAMAGDFVNTYGVYAPHSAVRFCQWFVRENADSADTSAILSRLNAGIYFNTGMFLANMAELRRTFVSAANLRDLVVLMQDKGAPQVDHDLFNCYCRVLRVSGAYNATGNTHYPHDPVYCVYDASSGSSYPKLRAQQFI